MTVRTSCRVLLAGTATSICAMLLTWSPAQAQAAPLAASGSQASTTDPTEANKESPPSTSGIGEVIVTAQKRSENAQRVPLSIQAFSGSDLAARGVTDTSRLDVLTPGLTFSTYGNDAKIALRGANANNTYQDASPVVGMFVDGVYQLRASQQTASFFDVSRVEVLKGPQGTLYGRNTLAGAINVYTNAPDLTRESFGLTASYGNYRDLRSEAYLNVPLSENFAVRVAGLQENSDGYIKNDDGPNLNIVRTLAARGSALWKPSDAVTAVLRVSDTHQGGTPAVNATTGLCRHVAANGLTDPLGPNLDCQNPRRGSGGTPPFSSFGKLRVSRDFVPNEKYNDFNATLDVSADLGFTSLRSISSYTNYKSTIGQDSDFSPNPYFREWFEENAKAYSQELDFHNSSASRLEYTVGAYFERDEEFFADSQLFQTVDQNDTTTRPLATSTNGVQLPVLNGTPLVSLQTNINRSVGSYQFININNLGGFGQLTYHVTDKFRVTGGIRYSREHKEAYSGTSKYTGSLTPAVIPITPVDFTFTKSSSPNVAKTFDGFTYHAGAEYDLAPRVLAYFSYGTGFLSGALNSNNTVTGLQKSASYEGGIKSRFLDNRVQLDAAVYHVDYTNLSTSLLLPTGFTITANGGDIKVNGAEVLLDVLPVDALRISVGVAYQDSKYGTYGIANRQQVVNGAVPPNNFIDESGMRTPLSPVWTGNGTISYKYNLASGGSLTPQAHIFYSAKYSACGATVFDLACQQKAYSKTDASLTYASPSGKYEIEGFVQNIENSQPNVRTQTGTDGIEQVTFGQPRTYGVRVRLRF